MTDIEKLVEDGEGWIEIAQRGFDVWKAKPHNARWFRKIDGTPIPNDLTICIGEAFSETIRSLTAAKDKAERERDQWQQRESETQEALQAIGEEFGAHGGEPRTDAMRRLLTEDRARITALEKALSEAERFMAYFAGETDGVFVGPGTPKSCLETIRRARAIVEAADPARLRNLAAQLGGSRQH